MKKTLLIVFSSLVLSISSFAQVLQSSGVENTVWTGFGGPLGSNSFKYYGTIDTLQARVDIGIFTIDGMINWGTPFNYGSNGKFSNISIENTSRSALSFHYFDGGADTNNVVKYEYDNATQKPTYNNSSNGYRITQSDSYYINFLIHPFKGFDAGFGTKLNWSVGPSPGYGAWVWEPNAHIRSGGFSTSYDDRYGVASRNDKDWNPWNDKGNYKFIPDRPGDYDVVGFVPVANKYAKTAIAARYKYNDLFQVGIAVPSGANTSAPVFNLAFEIKPVDFLTLATAYEGIIQGYGNFYFGTSIIFTKNFGLDAWFGWDAIDANKNTKDMSWTTGAIFTIGVPQIGMVIRPEGGINFFENPYYTPSWYAGGSINFKIGDKVNLGAWSSIAGGSADRRWYDNSKNAHYEKTKDYTGGLIFDIRPVVNFAVTKNHILSTNFDFELRKAFDGTTKNAWSFGFYWTYKYGV